MIERRLKSHVLDEIVDSAVSECRDPIYDECKTNEAEFREQVDDGNSEVRNTANECMNEIKKQARMYMHEMEEQAQQYMKDIEDQGIEVKMSAEAKVAKFKRWFNASAQSLLSSESSPSHEPGAKCQAQSF
jgi:sugar-specific transcriptional regulator TrmB